MAYKLEYLWLDGYKPEPSIRSKTKIVDSEPKSPEECPGWNFDGSSTQQAEGHSSDCLLKPVRLVKDPLRKNASLVMCEVLSPDGSVHPSNLRGTFEDDADLWLGFEQEYTLTKDGKPLGFPKDGYPAPQGPYYCSVGIKNCVGRDLVEEHLDACLEAGLSITGINAEVMKGQWEYQLFGKGAKKACDDAWIARYLLSRCAEKYDIVVELHPKPVKGDWNGSGMHTNFSTTPIRDKGGEEFIRGICEKFRTQHNEHIASYGSDNDQRLTGLHETQSIHKFSYGVSDRGSSIRIPIGTAQNGWKGYLEDRRPASNADPYKVTARIPAADRSSKRLLLMMHGLGDSHAGYLWMPEVLRLPWLNYALPNAPDDYYGGYAWFDIYGDMLPGVRRSREQLFELLDSLRDRGWPTEQTVIGGFSQGGLMALEVGLRYPRRFAGVLSISGLVCQPDKLIQELSPVAHQQRLLATHGTLDPILPFAVSQRQIRQLQDAGLSIAWHEFRKEHTIAGEEEVRLIRDFIVAGFGEDQI